MKYLFLLTVLLGTNLSYATSDILPETDLKNQIEYIDFLIKYDVTQYEVQRLTQLYKRLSQTTSTEESNAISHLIKNDVSQSEQQRLEQLRRRRRVLEQRLQDLNLETESNSVNYNIEI